MSIKKKISKNSCKYCTLSNYPMSKIPKIPHYPNLDDKNNTEVASEGVYK